MDDERFPAISHRAVRLAAKMHDPAYRHGYVEAHSRRFLARQMRGFRGDKSQTEFGIIIDKRQTVVSRLEDPNYRGWTLGTMFEIARKVGVAVFVRFVDFETFLKYSDDLSEDAIHPQPYNADAVDAFTRGMVDMVPGYVSEADISGLLGVSSPLGLTGTTLGALNQAPALSGAWINTPSSTGFPGVFPTYGLGTRVFGSMPTSNVFGAFAGPPPLPPSGWSMKLQATTGAEDREIEVLRSIILEHQTTIFEQQIAIQNLEQTLSGWSANPQAAWIGGGLPHGSLGPMANTQGIGA